MRAINFIILWTLVVSMESEAVPRQYTPVKEKQLTVSQIALQENSNTFAVRVVHQPRFEDGICLKEGVEIVAQNNILERTRQARYINPNANSAEDCGKSPDNSFVDYIGNIPYFDLPDLLTIMSENIKLYCDDKLDVKSSDQNQRASFCKSTTKRLSRIIGYSLKNSIELRLIFVEPDHRAVGTLINGTDNEFIFDVHEFVR